MKRRDFLKTVGLAAGAVTFNGLAALTPAGAASPVLGAELAIGDVFTIAGKYAVNPITRKATKHLQQFVVTSINEPTIGISPHHP